MINFEGQLQEEEFRRAQWLSSPGVVRWMGWLMVAALGLVLLTGGMQPLMADPVPNTIKLFAGVAFAVFMIVAPRRAISRVWNSTPLLRERVSGSLTENGVAWKTASTDSTYEWDKFTKRRMGKDLLLLYTSTRQALIIPRSYFRSGADWEAAGKLIEKNIAAA